jgi:hypothetical protein
MIDGKLLRKRLAAEARHAEKLAKDLENRGVLLDPDGITSPLVERERQRIIATYERLLDELRPPR